MYINQTLLQAISCCSCWQLTAAHKVINVRDVVCVGAVRLSCQSIHVVYSAEWAGRKRNAALEEGARDGWY